MTVGNPMTNLHSEERIQGNPSFSNTQNRGFPWEGDALRKPKSGSTGLNVAAIAKSGKGILF
jgi:hypothetical protein